MIAAILARESNRKGDTSVQNQVDIGLAVTADRGWTVPPHLIFRKQRTQAVIARCPVMQAILECAGRGEFQALWAKDDSRLDRNVFEFPAWLDAMSRCGVQVWAGSTLLNPESETARQFRDRMTRSVDHTAYRLEVSEKVKASYELRRSQGISHAAACFGWKHVNRLMVPDEATMHLVVEAYTRSAAGEPVNRIATDWRKRGIVGVRGGPIVAASLRHILRNPRNKGVMPFRGQETGTPNKGGRIVSDELWAAGQPKGKPGRPEGHYIFVFGGKLYTSDCTVTAEAHAGWPLPLTQRYYGRDRVPQYRRSRDPVYWANVCKPGTPDQMDAAATDALLLAALLEHLSDEPLLLQEVGNSRVVLAGIDAEIDRDRQAIKAAQNAAGAARTRLDRALDMNLREEAIAQDAALREAQAREAAARAELASHLRRRQQVEASLPTPETVNLLRECVRVGDMAGARRLVQELVAWVDVAVPRIYLSGSPGDVMPNSTGTDAISLTACR